MKNIAKKLVVARLNKKVKKLLASHSITVVGVTGSVGKTSTKHAIGEVLSATRKVRYSEDSYNTDIGIPLSIFGQQVPTKLWDLNSWKKIFANIDAELADYRYDTLVLELAEDELAMMQKILKIIPLTIGVITEATPAHTDKMQDAAQILRDSMTIVSGAKHIFYNADNPELAAKIYKTRTTGFGIRSGSVRFAKVQRGGAGYLKAELVLAKQKRMVQTKMVGQQNLYGLCAAAAVAHHLEIPFAAICFELEQIRPVKGRMNLLPAKNNAQIIDDSYNSSPVAAIEALKTLEDMGGGSKIAVLGNMNELGGSSASLHEQVGKFAAKIVDLLVVIGPDAQAHLAPAAAQAGLISEKIKVFRTPYEAGHYLKNIIQKGDTVLIKGSQNNVFSEEVCRILLADGIDPKEVLVRQSKDWRRKKKKSFAQ